jgi:hypothetical protein
VLYVKTGGSSGIYRITVVTSTVLTVEKIPSGSPVVTIINETYEIVKEFSRPTSATEELAETYAFRQLRNRDIEIEYEWSSSVKDVNDYVEAKSTRSLNQDLMVRHGIPVYANIQITVNSQFVTESDMLSAIHEFVLALNNTPLRTSSLVRLPKVADHIPIPVVIIGVVYDESRRFSVYRSDDGIAARRIEAILPNEIVVDVA